MLPAGQLPTHHPQHIAPSGHPPIEERLGGKVEGRPRVAGPKFGGRRSRLPCSAVGI